MITKIEKGQVWLDLPCECKRKITSINKRTKIIRTKALECRGREFIQEGDKVDFTDWGFESLIQDNELKLSTIDEIRRLVE